MNTHNENLQQTVVNTLSALALKQSSLESLKTVAEYTLYHAQGAELTARDKLEGTKDDITTWQDINNQSLINANQAFNLLASATDANADVAVSITNTATAAANVQIASNAISLLASDIGAVFNIATASLYQTDAYERIHSANSLINEVANESNRISKSAMNASVFTSEITISAVLSQTTSVKSKIDSLFESTQVELDKFSKLAITENMQIIKASKAERQAEGGLSDAQREVVAIDNAYVNTNNQLNQYLSINVVSGFEIAASFAALPLPTFYSPQASGVTIPPAHPNYYLTLIPAQNQTMFSIDQVEQLFAQRPVGDNSQFFKVTPDVSVDASGIVTRTPITIPLSHDAFGNRIQAGKSYVAFLYIELSKQYKQYISNFSNLLSAPSQAFIPATALPLAQNLVVTPDSTPDADHVTWTTGKFLSRPLTLPPNTVAVNTDTESANNASADPDHAVQVAKPEFRCILVEQSRTQNLNLMGCPEKQNTSPIYFNLAIAEQVSQANYICAQAMPDGYEIKFSSITTDNFGNMIKPNTLYKPYILTVAGGDSSDQAQYTNVLANTFPAITVCTHLNNKTPRPYGEKI